jgi:hypothetical protein
MMTEIRSQTEGLREFSGEMEIFCYRDKDMGNISICIL